jgi:tetratricopeptide (TPR) repeat protein
MSLINDMLKSLEQRAQKMPSSTEISIGLKAGVARNLSAERKNFVLLSALLLFSFLLLWMTLHHRHALHVRAKQDAVTLKQASTPIDSHIATPTAGTSATTLLTGVALQVEQNTTSLRFLLNQHTLYRLSNDVSKNELIIVLDKTNLLAALPKIDYAGSGVKDIQAFSDDAGNLKLLLSLDPTTEVKRLDLNEEGKAPELQLELRYKTSPTNTGIAATIPVSIKHPIVESATEEQYQQALKLSAAGQDNQAIYMLKNLQTDFPQYHQGREFLVKLLMRNGHIAEANRVLAVGLMQQPHSANYVELKARLLVEEGKIDQAVSLLESAAPSLKTNPEYHALTAALYQRQGRSALAANLYKELLRTNSGNAKWWLGLGVALDSTENHSQAVEAYANANTVGGLNPELKAYVETQLHPS